MEKRRNSRTSNLKSATTKAKATVKSTVEKIEKTPAAEKTVKAVKKATETVAAKAPEVVEEVKNTVKNHKISGITLEIFETSITVADLEAAVKKDAEAKGLKGKELHIYVNAEERAAYFEDVARVARAIMAAFHPDKVNYGAYGDTGHHLHFHLCPKYKDEFEWGGVFLMNPDKKYLTDAEYAEMIEKIKEHLQ